MTSGISLVIIFEDNDEQLFRVRIDAGVCPVNLYDLKIING